MTLLSLKELLGHDKPKNQDEQAKYYDEITFLPLPLINVL